MANGRLDGQSKCKLEERYMELRGPVPRPGPGCWVQAGQPCTRGGGAMLLWWECDGRLYTLGQEMAAR